MIKTIEFKNFLSFNENIIDFKKNKFIFLFGENGSGKTTIINSIKFLKVSILTLYARKYLSSYEYRDDEVHYSRMIHRN
jgi:AAA15 family ATPase/GTPase